MAQARGGCSFSTLASEKAGGCKGVPHAYKGLTRHCRFPIPCSCLLPPQKTSACFLGPSLVGMGAGQGPQHLCLRSLKEDTTQPWLHWLAACSSLIPTSPRHLLPQMREGDSFTTHVSQQELQSLWGDGGSFPVLVLVGIELNTLCREDASHRLPKGKLFCQAGEYLGGGPSKVLPHPRP